MKRAVFSVLLLGATLLLSATVAEWKLRADAASESNREARTRLHPFLQILPAATYVNGLNAYRFRGEPIEVQKPPRTFRVFALGGSTTLGIRNTYSQTYPAILQELLRKQYPDVRIEVQNAGVDWYTTIHTLLNYELRVRDFQPDLIIVFVAMNDLYRSFSPSWWAAGGYKPDYSHYLGPFARFLGPEVAFISALSPESGLSRLLVWNELTRVLRHDPSPYDLSKENVQRLKARMRSVDVTTFRSADSYRKYYDLLIRTIQQDGRRLLMASEPFFYHDQMDPADEQSLFFAPVFCAENGRYPDMPSMTRGMQTFNGIARELATARGVPFLDFEALVPDSSVYFADDVHLTGRGNMLLAQNAFAWIVEQRLVNDAP